MRESIRGTSLFGAAAAGISQDEQEQDDARGGPGSPTGQPQAGSGPRSRPARSARTCLVVTNLPLLRKLPAADVMAYISALTKDIEPVSVSFLFE